SSETYQGTAETSLKRSTVCGGAVSPTCPACPAGPLYFSPIPTGGYDMNTGCAANQLWSFHKGGCPFAFADGSVHFISYDITPQLMLDLSTMAGGETLAGLSSWY